MKNKQRPNEFYITFDLSDPRHKAAVDILNSKGRKKAQFIADAVLNYTNKNVGTTHMKEVDPKQQETRKTILDGLNKLKEK